MYTIIFMQILRKFIIYLLVLHVRYEYYIKRETSELNIPAVIKVTKSCIWSEAVRRFVTSALGIRSEMWIRHYTLQH
jgi:hypothetical protein